MASSNSSPAWKALQAHHSRVAPAHMRTLFEEDPERFSRFSLKHGDLLLDYSKNRVTAETMSLLADLARAADVEGWRRRMFAGERINTSEDRAALHVALRNRSGRPMAVDGADVMPAVEAVLSRMRAFADELGGGAWKGATGTPITDVVNIGIGGSHLGPAMVVEALTPYRKPGLGVHFVSNVDGTHMVETLKGLEAATTLFIVVSKTFTTVETVANAKTARAWLAGALGEAAVGRHFAAVTANAGAAADFGVEAEHVFELWDWVGGRTSLWSAAGLSIAVAVGMDRFEELLDGAHAMDEHFLSAPLEANMPVVLALLGVWYIDFFGAGCHAVVPYDQYLRRLPAHLQQLDMESNGKSVTRDGAPAARATAPVVFGAPGTDGQHAFFQLLHQGTRLIPADFIAAAETHNPVDGHHALLLANFFAQSAALMTGGSAMEAAPLAPHKALAGNRPSNSILVRRFDARTLGMLIALYEHKVFVQGVIWGINSFDQWGVELGKELAGTILPAIEDAQPARGHDSSTDGLINHFKALRAGPP